jgi:hypothetical protein
MWVKFVCEQVRFVGEREKEEKPNRREESREPNIWAFIEGGRRDG